MKSILKTVVAGLIATTMGTASLAVYANEGCHERGGYGKSHDPAARAERFEKHQAKLHDKLKITSAQEAAWTAFVAKVKPTPPPPRPEGSEAEKMKAPERMAKMLDRMKEHQGMMENRLAAVKEFYATLTPEQQQIFDDQFGRWSGHSRHGGRHHRDHEDDQT